MITYLFLQTTNNCPDVILQGDYGQMWLLTSFLFFSTFVNYLIFRWVILGAVNESYKATVLEDLQEIINNEKVLEALEGAANYREADYEKMERMIVGR